MIISCFLNDIRLFYEPNIKHIIRKLSWIFNENKIFIYLLFLYDFNELIIFYFFIPTDKTYKDVFFLFESFFKMKISFLLKNAKNKKMSPLKTLIKKGSFAFKNTFKIYLRILKRCYK